MSMGAKRGMLLVKNADGTWNVDFDDGSEADLADFMITLESDLVASPTKAAVGPNGETVEQLQEQEAKAQAEHDAAVERGDYKAAGELLQQIAAKEELRKRLERGDRKVAREREKTEHKQKLEEMRAKFEKDANKHMDEMKSRISLLQGAS